MALELWATTTAVGRKLEADYVLDWMPPTQNHAPTAPKLKVPEPHLLVYINSLDAINYKLYKRF